METQQIFLVLLLSLFHAECHEIEENQLNIVKTMLASPIRSRHVLQEKADDEVNKLEEISSDNEIDPFNDEIQGSRIVKKDKVNFYEEEVDTGFNEVIKDILYAESNYTSRDENETETARNNEEMSSLPVYITVIDGVKKVTSMFQDCYHRINTRLRQINQTDPEDKLSDFKSFVQMIHECIKIKTFRQLDVALEQDVVRLTKDIQFKRDFSRQRSLDENNSDITYVIPTIMNGKIVLPKTSVENIRNVTAEDIMQLYASDILENDWNDLLLERIGRLFETHTLKFNFNASAIEGRGRRRNQMFQMMVMGFMVMATILIPMGFQFLTVLGGKSLLMAKMALIMSAINGLKKIATSHIDYGLYHSPPVDVHSHPHDHHHHGFHDKVFKIASNEPIFK